jgi:hypothetical protein
VGNKLGSKYLRAPDIFFTILEKGNKVLRPLSKLATVNEGKPTGVNEFFFLPKDVAEKFRIEKRFLHLGIMKTRGFNYFEITPAHIDRYFFACDEPRTKLRHTQALLYIEEGESRELNKRKTYAKKKDWWAFQVRKPAQLVGPCGLGDVFFCAKNSAGAVCSNSYTEFRVNDAANADTLWVYLNSVVGYLWLEILGRTSLGGGMLKVDPIEYRQILVPDDRQLKERSPRIKNRKIQSIFDECGLDINKPFREQEPNPPQDRKTFDDIVFDALGLTDDERKEVYWSLCELVKTRLDKARSLMKTEMD